MGRLTLNVLLSFAQFEREVTGERIRDKIAASKRKGMWMGGWTPIGYRAHERTLVIDSSEADRVRQIYQMYLDLGCVRRLKDQLDRNGWVTSPRQTGHEKMTGGKSFSRGHLYRILSNPIYAGRVAHKDQVYEGLHPAIIEADLWEAVQDKLQENRTGHRTRACAADPSLLTGLLFDYQGQRLTPTHAKKGVRRYRYYVNHAVLMGDLKAKDKALRWPAHGLEAAVVGALVVFLRDESRLVSEMGQGGVGETRSRLKQAAQLADEIEQKSSATQIGILQRLISSVTVHPDKLQLALKTQAIWDETAAAADHEPAVIDVPVQLKRSGMSMKLIIQGSKFERIKTVDHKLVAMLAKARQWFDRLSSGSVHSVQELAAAQKVTTTYVMRVIYLAFLAPDIVQRFARGEHPKELSARRLSMMTPLPDSWPAQREILGMTD